MTRRFKLWRVVASLFTLVNLGGGLFAVASGEVGHALLHACLLLLGVYWMSRLAARAASVAEPGSSLPEGLVDRLQERIDGIAIEVERIGEAQRFMTRVYQERAQNAAVTGGDHSGDTR